MYCSVHLIAGGFWCRLKNSIKYLFGCKYRYGDFDEFIFKQEDAEKLQEVVDCLKRIDRRQPE